VIRFISGLRLEHHGLDFLLFGGKGRIWGPFWSAPWVAGAGVPRGTVEGIGERAVMIAGDSPARLRLPRKQGSKMRVQRLPDRMPVICANICSNIGNALIV
jgi:hypothetical protein